ncbi:sulfotransferase family 2 domain-containing protein [Cytobacillus purgationiresistens]|uniref:Sulfotransferase family protein n=1 Tax=Cytobacillus purgationiresistens TaxID=863449 RepID=A0ABU0AKV0_9BACI|nr:sulfotransferase family 2 domain-containing protein [Cytobacillus purgationiresistens]MDQ0271889.1 hypothetical protein [Cytobacillus purgationiresistens]
MDNNMRDIILKSFQNGLPLYDPDFPLVIYWSPKAGCTSIIKWFYHQTDQLSEALAYNQWVHAYRSIQQNKEYFENVYTDLLEGKKNTYKLVRNPYKRAVSSFYAVLYGPTVRDHAFPNHTEGFSFKEFLYLIKEKGVKPGEIDIHISQQFLDGEEHIVKDYIKVEDFQSSIKMLEQEYQLPPSPIMDITHSPHHLSKFMTLDGTNADLTIPFDSPDCIPSYESLYNEETMSLVRTLYKKDFEIYGYDEQEL